MKIIKHNIAIIQNHKQHSLEEQFLREIQRENWRGIPRENWRHILLKLRKCLANII